MSWILKIKIFKYFTFTQHKRQTYNADTNAFDARVTKTGSVMVTTLFFPLPQNSTQNSSEKGKCPSTYHHWAVFFYKRKGNR
jgi:hypothetical protein